MQLFHIRIRVFLFSISESTLSKLEIPFWSCHFPLFSITLEYAKKQPILMQQVISYFRYTYRKQQVALK